MSDEKKSVSGLRTQPTLYRSPQASSAASSSANAKRSFQDALNAATANKTAVAENSEGLSSTSTRRGGVSISVATRSFRGENIHRDASAQNATTDATKAAEEKETMDEFQMTLVRSVLSLAKPASIDMDRVEATGMEDDE